MIDPTRSTPHSTLAIPNPLPLETPAIAETQLAEPPAVPSLLPRSAWHSQVAYLKTVLKAKQRLDQREQEWLRRAEPPRD
jgi:hypothetical protein